ncbi:MAG: hypothetical protein HUU12_12505 [Anaerolineales bacterium]|nr:hypothetical protein [Anaerolineales bacterium]
MQYSLVGIVGLASFVILISPLGATSGVETAGEGDVAQTTIQSPRDIEYVSEIRTEEARKAAESAVQPVYSSPRSNACEPPCKILHPFAIMSKRLPAKRKPVSWR